MSKTSKDVIDLCVRARTGERCRLKQTRKSLAALSITHFDHELVRPKHMVFGNCIEVEL